MKSVSTLRFLPITDGKQPLFMWSMVPFLKVFEDPLIAGRMVSVCTGILSVIGIFLLTWVLFKSRKTAILASFFWAISPFTVFFDRMALVDSMLTMFGIWAMLLGVVTTKTLRLDMAMLTGFSLGGAWLTKSPAIFFLALLPSTIFLFNKPNKLFNLNLLKLLGLWTVSGIIAFVMYNILRLGSSFHMIAQRNQDYIYPLSNVLTSPWNPFRHSILPSIEWFWALIPGSILFFALIAVIMGTKKFWREYAVLLSWLLVPLFVEAEFAKALTARYILFLTPPIFILAALALTQLVKLKTGTYWLLVVGVSLPALWINYLLLTNPQKAPLPRVERSGYLEEWTSGTGIREVAQFIKEEHEREPDKQIIVGTEGFFGTMPDGLMIYLSDIPKVVVVGVGLSISVVHDPLYVAKKTGDKVYLVANTSRMEVAPEDLGYNVLASFPKATQPSGKVESLLLLEVTKRSLKIAEDAKEKARKEQQKQDVNKK